ncbi:uncharacterized protein KQ657_001713 [Scheffersomyces spartinae]|uniref:Uncharacterized protein n=1 Tax=Scheffersomyces spartinae TaxID=45513 RepID=A0A9P8AHE6_9ASCO|nr:uncharacterized protein KQ657_001713 [Scheffersomyces spartinae]KAG7192613.1 hypothetical protein KQ657_001713 [Scheffersomyces spartinae]
MGRLNQPRLVAMAVLIFILVVVFNRRLEPSYGSVAPVDEIEETNGYKDDFLDKNVLNRNGEKLKTAPKLIISDEVTKDMLRAMDKKQAKCPDYVDYSSVAHGPLSSGKHRYPYMRPAPKCRTFSSEAVELLIAELKKRVEDVDLGRLIENTLPNTLDSTILWHLDEKQGGTRGPQSFVVTGDIHAEWLRDAARQLSVYQPLVKYDTKLRTLIKGAINTQAEFLNSSPYCNAFQPPIGSGIKKKDPSIDHVIPRPDWRRVFECKYEVDSLASFLTLSNEYYDNSDGGDTSFINYKWMAALEKLLIVVKREMIPSFNKDNGEAMGFYYVFQRNTNIGSETLPLAGTGNPVNYGTGLVRSAFRPSDDACILQFFIPGNIHLLTELKRMRRTYFNQDKLPEFNIELFTSNIDFLIKKITKGIETYGIVDHPVHGKVYAYEVDGYGGNIFMDDANIPSLLAIPDMGFGELDDPVYQNTRKMILSKSGNPYYLKGKFFKGIGGPHVGVHNAWPMSLLVGIRTTNDDDEIINNLNLVMATTGGLGLMHETVHVGSEGGYQYTRPWFAWCNSEFGKTILHLAKHKPHLIFKDEYKNEPFDIHKIIKKQ